MHDRKVIDNQNHKALLRLEEKEGVVIWPVGSFRFSEVSTAKINRLYEMIIETFKIPCWPELVGLGKSEELIGFWQKLFIEWLECEKNDVGQSFISRELIKKKLSERPGLRCFFSKHKERKLNFIKGQMIGPVTLKWSMQKNPNYKVSDNEIIKFISESFFVQSELLEDISESTVISLDEPCAFLIDIDEVNSLWSSFFEKIDLLGINKKNDLAAVALHCCGEPIKDWLEHNWSVIHFDCEELFVAETKCSWDSSWESFFKKNGVFAAGKVPSSNLLKISEILFDDLNNNKVDNKKEKNFFSKVNNSKMFLSTTCGIDGSSLEEIESTLNKLKEVALTWDKNRT